MNKLILNHTRNNQNRANKSHQITRNKAGPCQSFGHSTVSLNIYTCNSNFYNCCENHHSASGTPKNTAAELRHLSFRNAKNIFRPRGLVSYLVPGFLRPRRLMHSVTSASRNESHIQNSFNTSLKHKSLNHKRKQVPASCS